MATHMLLRNDKKTSFVSRLTPSQRRLLYARIWLRKAGASQHLSSMRLLGFAVPLLISFMFSTNLTAQLETGSPSSSLATGPQFSDPTPVQYEFGLKISSAGESTGIIGTLPIPIDWPEQTVTIVGQKKTANVRSISFKKLNKDVRQMTIKVNRLSAGDVAEATILVRAEKRNILPPVHRKQRSKNQVDRSGNRHRSESGGLGPSRADL